MSTQMDMAIAAIKTGKVTPYTAFKMVDGITEDQKDVLRSINEQLLTNVCNHQDKMDRVMFRSF